MKTDETFIPLLDQSFQVPHTLSKNEFQEIRRALHLKPNFLVTLGVLLGDFFVFGLGLWLVAYGSIWSYGIAQPLFALAFFHMFLMVHECGHGTCASSKWLNNLTGHLVSIFCFMPYFPWQYIHREHHKLAGNIDKDPVLKLVRDYDQASQVKNSIVRFAWKTWIPLLAFFQQFVYWGYPIELLKQEGWKSKKSVQCLVSILFLILVYSGLIYYQGDWFNLATFGPALIIYFVAIELVNFPHHMNAPMFKSTGKQDRLPLWEQSAISRSCFYPVVWSELLMLNFNFHIEHHLFPTLPWYRLRKARELVRDKLGSGYQEVTGTQWNIENRRREPEDVFLRSRETYWYI